MQTMLYALFIQMWCQTELTAWVAGRVFITISNVFIVKRYLRKYNISEVARSRVWWVLMPTRDFQFPAVADGSCAEDPSDEATLLVN